MAPNTVAASTTAIPVLPTTEAGATTLGRIHQVYFHLTGSPLLSIVTYHSKQSLSSIVLSDTVLQHLLQYLSYLQGTYILQSHLQHLLTNHIDPSIRHIYADYSNLFHKLTKIKSLITLDFDAPWPKQIPQLCNHLRNMIFINSET